jgi:RNA polymerase sigma factor (sigma-70 family)
MQTASYTDADIIRDIQSDEHLERAVAHVYQEYYGLLEKMVLQNSGNAADAEDVVQEVLIAFVEMVRKDKYQGKASVKSFLYTLARNIWISELRKRGSAGRRHEQYESERDDSQSDISEYLSYQEGQQFIRQLFAQLGEKCQQILSLFYYGDYSMKEILQQTDYENEQVLRNKKYKCLKTLISKVQQSPVLYDQLKNALHHAKW